MTHSSAKALVTLQRLRVRAAARSMFGQLKTVRGALLALIAGGFFAMVIVANVLSAAVGRPDGAAEAPPHLEAYVAIGILVACLATTLTSAGEQAIYFSPAEVDLLFPGPFSRRELLLYKIIPGALASLLMGLLFATTMSMYTRSWPASLVGLALAFQFIKGVSMCGQLLVQSVTERAYTTTRKLVLGGVVLAIALAASQAFTSDMPTSLGEAADAFCASAAGRVLLAPFTPFAKAMLAEGLTPALFGWAAVSAALVGGMYAVALALDANYLEAAVRVSQRIQEQKQRMARGGVFAASKSSNFRGNRVPRLPWLGGAGPIARRQFVIMSRQARGAVLLALLAGAPLAFVVFRRSGFSADADSSIPWIAVSIAAYMTLLISMQGMLAFKSDLDHMDLLKSLPIRPTPLAVGETAPIVLGATAFHALLAGVLAVVFPHSAFGMAAVGAFSLPFNAILFGVDNMLFLTWPHRLAASGEKSLLATAQIMLLMLVKTLALAVCAGVAALPAGVVYAISGNIVLAGAACWTILMAEVVGVAVALGWAFDRFDVGREAV